MQYIKKQNTPPSDWDKWFITATGEKSFDYGKDYNSLTNLRQAREFLISEQHGLCAYCQQTISIENSSIEHVIPKELNKELSTNYFNLVAVCKTQLKDPHTNKLHCDKEKGSDLISSFIFVSNSEVTETKNNSYFTAFSNGIINPKPALSDELRQQVEAFIKVLNLNHSNLAEKRVKDVLNGLISAYSSLPQNQKKSFWKNQFKRFLQNKKQPYRQFLLIYIGMRIGIN